MTRLDIEIQDVVLRGLPASCISGLGDLIQERIGALARGEDARVGAGEVSDAASLADLLADRVWADVRATGALGGGAR